MDLQSTDVDNLIKEAVEKAKKTLQQDLRDGLYYRIEDQIKKTVAKEVSEWFAVNMVPLIRKTLEDSKGAITQAVIESTEKLGKALAEGLVSEIQQKMKTDWKRREIFSTLFK